ncbi:Hsp33 family molecular chaperone HslO [Leptospira sp. GIMC2001]|uniref:Hsp33 family molecular chaperone HslO n=1 Tax=Leptospira sp. GIMC2001 TaxID=1513297 RepID=UPI00234A11CF|nr:Hsp33 family molecular chaperone HslO [Leptospira sp. GIMC2001]WCL49551.1 Hsp33 family molecular chaperone HslO [Leptospira sp. GIMC2001]
MSDSFITGILPNSQFRLSIVDCSEVCSHLIRIHDLDPRMSNFLSKTMMGAFFIAKMVKEDQRISIQWKDEYKQSVLAYSNRQGAMKGVAYPGPLESGDIRNDFILGTGILKVIRWDPDHEFYQSFTNLVEDSFEVNFAKYITESEQTLSLVFMNTSEIKFGEYQVKGIFLQALPDATEASREFIFKQAENELKKDSIFDLEIEEIRKELSIIFRENCDILDTGSPHFQCDCSYNKIAEVLVSLGEKEVQEILTEQGKIEVECEFCKSIYEFDDSKVHRLFPN